MQPASDVTGVADIASVANETDLASSDVAGVAGIASVAGEIDVASVYTVFTIIILST